jgi:short-subunit dehydrogenase
MSKPTALITGASSGIGKALAIRFAEAGHDLILAARGVERMEALAAELKTRFPVTVTVIGADLEAPDGAARLHAEVTGRGLAVGILVNNAGYGIFGEFKDAELGPQLGMIQLNVVSLVTLSKLCLPGIIAARGKIMNVASTAAFQPGPYMAVYYATKAFVLFFSEALAAELEETGVTVTALCPGPTASGFQDKAAMNESRLVKGRKIPGADVVAKFGYAALMKGQRVAIPGLANWLGAQGVRFSPRNVVTRMVKLISKPV